MRNIYEIKYLKYSATKYRIHKGISFFVVLKGSVMLSIKGISTFYNEGETFIVKQNECYKLDVSEDNVVVQIHFYESLIENMVPELSLKDFHLKEQKEIKGLRVNLIQLCCTHLSKASNRNLKIMKNLINILESCNQYINFCDGQCPAKHHNVHPVVSEIKDYIYEHYNERITMNTFTKKYHISKSYFSKTFKEQMGMNFKDYLTEIRLLNSIYDLIHTHEKIIDISEKHGFYNVSAYINAFKLDYGITPKKYRDMFQSENTSFARQNFFNEVDYEKKLSMDEIKSHLKNFENNYLELECV